MNLKFRGCVYGVLLLAFVACKTDDRQITADMLHFPPAEGTETRGEVPVIEFDSIESDFGSIAIGEKYVHIFRFKNTGSLPLVISQVTPSCGCTTPRDWPHEPVAPGESGQITVEFDSKGFPGKIDKSVSVVTNCIPKVWNLRITGEVRGVETKETPPDKPFEMERSK